MKTKFICSLCGGDTISKDSSPAYCPKCMSFSITNSKKEKKKLMNEVICKMPYVFKEILTSKEAKKYLNLKDKIKSK